MLAALTLLSLSVHAVVAVQFSSVYTWPEFEYEWPADKDEYLRGVNYFPGKLKARHVAVHGQKLFISLHNYGAPATLVSVPTTSSSPPKLTAFPSWPSQKKYDCKSIQSAQGIEADTKGRLWVVDEGNSDCPAKLWIYDAATEGKVELVHEFPESVVSREFFERLLREIVLDETPDDWLAYVSDALKEHLVVFSLKSNRSWTVRTPGLQSESLALSAKTRAERKLYSVKFASRDLYSLPVSQLRDASENATTQFVGTFSAHPYNLLIDSGNVLHAAFQHRNYISVWDTSKSYLRETDFFVSQNLASVESPFVFTLGSNGTVWMLERRQNGDKQNHELLRAQVDVDSYLYS